MRAAIFLIALLVASPAIAKEKPPTISYDPYTKTETIIGDDHSHMSILDEGFSGYQFSAAAVNGVMHHPILLYFIDGSDWYFIDRAADIDGNQLPVIQGGRDVDVNASIHENFGVEMTPEYLRSHRSTGMNIKLMGSRGEKVIKVSPEAVSTFDDVYERELAKFGGVSRAAPKAQAAVPVPPTVDSKSLKAFGQQAMSSIDPQMVRTLQAKLVAEYKAGDIGILAPVSPAGLFILAVAPSSPAAVAGLKPGEFIESANGISFMGLPQDAATAILKGLPKTFTFKVTGVGDVEIRR
jgi:hypothetical protein